MSGIRYQAKVSYQDRDGLLILRESGDEGFFILEFHLAGQETIENEDDPKEAWLMTEDGCDIQQNQDQLVIKFKDEDVEEPLVFRAVHTQLAADLITAMRQVPTAPQPAAINIIEAIRDYCGKAAPQTTATSLDKVLTNDFLQTLCDDAEAVEEMNTYLPKELQGQVSQALRLPQLRQTIRDLAEGIYSEELLTLLAALGLPLDLRDDKGMPTNDATLAFCAALERKYGAAAPQVEVSSPQEAANHLQL